jgi:hypothetical protein
MTLNLQRSQHPDERDRGPNVQTYQIFKLVMVLNIRIFKYVRRVAVASPRHRSAH